MDPGKSFTEEIKIITSSTNPEGQSPPTCCLKLMDTVWYSPLQQVYVSIADIQYTCCNLKGKTRWYAFTAFFSVVCFGPGTIFVICGICSSSRKCSQLKALSLALKHISFTFCRHKHPDLSTDSFLDSTIKIHRMNLISGIPTKETEKEEKIENERTSEDWVSGCCQKRKFVLSSIMTSSTVFVKILAVSQIDFRKFPGKEEW